MQRNWIGRTEGFTVQFDLVLNQRGSQLSVFTTRVDTLFGVQYIALSPNHKLVQRLAKDDSGLTQFLNQIPSLPPSSKAGYLLEGVVVNNPLLNLPDIIQDPDLVDNLSNLPVFVAAYVVDNDGDSAVMGVPAHDHRDFHFWRENGRNVPIRSVILPDPDTNHTQCSSIYTANGVLTSTCGSFSGLRSFEAGRKMVQLFRDPVSPSETPVIAAGVRWRLRDWLISRQRSWGTPIPIIHCSDCGPIPVPKNELPVQLPQMSYDAQRSERSRQPPDDWIEVKCPRCHSKARRETDTMDTFVDSSWYYIYYMGTIKNAKDLSSMAAECGELMPVNIYIGGNEHAILHLLYARFISKFLHDIGVWPFISNTTGEPFQRLISQGMVRGPTFTDATSGQFLTRDEVEVEGSTGTWKKIDGSMVKLRYEKMSKSKHNGVDPLECIKLHGSDATRAHMLFLAPIGEEINWDEQKIVGIKRWLSRIWRITHAIVGRAALRYPTGDAPGSMEDSRLTNASIHAISRVTVTLDSSLSANVVVSELQKLSNALDIGLGSGCSRLCLHATLSYLLRLMAPVCPGVAQACWHELYKNAMVTDEYVALSSWPVPAEVDSTVLEDCPTATSPGGLTTVQSAVQVNGKLRAVLMLELRNNVARLGEDEKRLHALEAIEQTSGGKNLIRQHNLREAIRTIVIKDGKTMNFVIKKPFTRHTS